MRSNRQRRKRAYIPTRPGRGDAPPHESLAHEFANVHQVFISHIRSFDTSQEERDRWEESYLSYALVVAPHIPRTEGIKRILRFIDIIARQIIQERGDRRSLVRVAKEWEHMRFVDELYNPFMNEISLLIIAPINKPNLEKVSDLIRYLWRRKTFGSQEMNIDFIPIHRNTSVRNFVRKLRTLIGIYYDWVTPSVRKMMDDTLNEL